MISSIPTTASWWAPITSTRTSAFRLQWMSVAAFVIAAVLVLAGRWKWALAPVLLLILKAIIPPIVSGVYVKPNELALQRPYHQEPYRGDALGLRPGTRV